MKNNENIHNISGKEAAILLMGETGSGKSTLAHWMMGTKLKAVKHGVDGFEGHLEEIGRQKSKTTIPNKFVINNELTVLDCPSFSSTLGGKQEIENSFNTKELFLQYKQMKFVLVLEMGNITSGRGGEFIRSIKQFCDSFKDIESVKDAVSLVITKIGSDCKWEVVKVLNWFQDVRSIKNKLRFEDQECAPEVFKMLGYLKNNIMLFNAPTRQAKKLETEELPKCELLENIDKICKYADTTKDIGKYNVSQESIDSFVHSYTEKDFETLRVLTKMDLDLNTLNLLPHSKETILVTLLDKNNIHVDAIRLLLLRGADPIKLGELDENQKTILNSCIKLKDFVNSLVTGVINSNDICEDFKELNIELTEEIGEIVTNKILNAVNIKDLIKWTVNLETNLETLKNNGLDSLCHLTEKLCIFGGKVETLAIKTLEKLASEEGTQITEKQFEHLQKLFGNKLKFAAIENMINSIKILPGEIIEIDLNINANGSEDKEVTIVAENFEDN